ncbi:MAG TPA: SHOCT domain-containing protein [Streptosporangiaceae bacterium]|nr:SHOCT domain-containing protein [Streptosporangiaceae bacterium]
MIGRRAVVRRRPLLRTAAIGGAGYMAGKAAGRRYEEQGGHAAQQAPAATPADSSAGPGPSAIDQLSQLSTLHQQGSLTDEEFAAAKAQILGT